MKNLRKKRIPPSTNKLFPVLILIATIFMGIGYASINSIVLNINGEFVAKAQEGIFITEVSYVERDNSLPNEDYSISYADNTILKSSINLEPNDLTSEVSLKLSFYNSTEYDYIFKDVVYAEELTDEVDDVYSNSNIIYTFDRQNETITKNGGTLEVIITFKYSEVNETISNILNSILNFKFYRLYTLSFDANGGTVDLSNKSVINNKKYGELPTPERNDYIFDGWYTEKSGGDLITADSIVSIENDQTLYAHWSLVKYTITYNINDGLVVPTNPSYYDRESTFTLNNPIMNRLGYRIEWTESLYTSNWENGFINLSTGAFEDYNSSYPNAVISEKIYLKAGVTYTLTGISAGENRWRFFDTSGNYVKNSSSLSFTPNVDGYVIILLHNGCDASTRNSLRIVSTHGDTVTIDKGSTGNRIYTVDLIPTKVVIADIFDRDEVTINGNTPKINSDGSVSFDSSEKFNNILVKLPEGDYSKGVTIALDAYLEIPDDYTGDLNDVQTLLMARTSTDNSVFLFQWQSRIHWDLGDASNYRNVLDKDLTKTGRYLFLLSYSSVSGEANKTIVIDKSTNEIIYNKTDKYSLESLNSGISLTNNELQIGGDYYKTNGYPYDAEPQTKFYSYFFDNIGMTNSELENLIFEFGYGNVEIS